MFYRVYYIRRNRRTRPLFSVTYDAALASMRPPYHYAVLKIDLSNTNEFRLFAIDEVFSYKESMLREIE